MSLEVFQLLDNEPIDNSIVKRDFLEEHHQQGVQLNQSNQNIENFFAEYNNYHQICKYYLEFDITIRKNQDKNFQYDDPVRLENKAFPLCFIEALLSTTLGSELEHNKFCGQRSTIMKLISNEDGEILSQFDNINEKDVPIHERLADLPP